ncbi:catalase [Sporosarcina sp. Te-1]|uniref:catalase n=1 Tax=Sporosarcina sp. Te-1 TaxID=2818390 RepID=UPI001A9FCC58|nr:catalase [Sporosarcina sp. Te-1]QTD41770.1 catalase [Sporosarcina sp. Te-1]
MSKELQKNVTPAEAVNTIERVVGTFPGYRRAHTKGIAFDAIFEPSGEASNWTRALHLQRDPVPAVVRFSHFWPTPDPNELLVPIKGMAVQFRLPDGSFTNLTMANIPVFITKTPEAFVRLLQVLTREPLSLLEKLEVLRRMPEFSTLPDLLRSLKPPISFATECYHSLHSFYLVSHEGERQAVRFTWEPLLSEGLKERKGFGPPTNLESELRRRLETGHQIRFRLILQLAAPEDNIDDPSIKWPKERKTVDAGLLTIKSIREESADRMVFDPTVMTDGIENSADPILHFRSPVYGVSANRRIHGR